ncbi:hypothetical protein FH972_024159 [Carpinus fangiana]|uniref:SURF1-like protein n=1 Tax=Carpinus fangiana TaxID=176857 RepID=A0A5N6KZQ8_9ROSI|nr:hypothetical protein FH972_024159 [Carpinus fangiana]
MRISTATLRYLRSVAGTSSSPFLTVAARRTARPSIAQHCPRRIFHSSKRCNEQSLSEIVNNPPQLVQRLGWKTDLIARFEDRLVRDPLPLPPYIDPAAVKDFDYRRVYATGVLRHDQEMLIGPRTHDGADGFLVITPLDRGDKGTKILVNRGWISREKADQRTRRQSLPKGQITVAGLLREPWKKNMFTPDNVPEKGQWYFPDVAKMAEVTGSQPVWIEETMQPDLIVSMNREAAGIPIGRAAEVNLRNNHTQYIFTWYALGLATSVMFYMVVKKPPSGGSSRVRRNIEWRQGILSCQGEAQYPFFSGHHSGHDNLSKFDFNQRKLLPRSRVSLAKHTSLFFVSLTVAMPVRDQGTQTKPLPLAVNFSNTFKIKVTALYARFPPEIRHMILSHLLSSDKLTLEPWDCVDKKNLAALISGGSNLMVNPFILADINKAARLHVLQAEKECKRILDKVRTLLTLGGDCLIQQTFGASSEQELTSSENQAELATVLGHSRDIARQYRTHGSHCHSSFPIPRNSLLRTHTGVPRIFTPQSNASREYGRASMALPPLADVGGLVLLLNMAASQSFPQISLQLSRQRPVVP